MSRKIRIWNLAVSVILLFGGLTYWNEARRLWSALTLFDENAIVQNFSNIGDIFHAVPLSRGDVPKSVLHKTEALTLPADLRRWFKSRNTTSLIVLHDGVVVFEEYYLGTSAEDLRIAWSISKSWLSVLFGIILEDGQIKSIDDPVIRYVPELAGSAYEAVTIRDVLTMSSGVRFDEDYLRFNSDINRMGRLLAIGGSIDKFSAGITDRNGPPGQDWLYVSIDTHVIGMVIRGATGRTLPDLMQEKVISPLGLESEGLYLTDSRGTAFALGGLVLTTLDQARFASMVLADGRWNGNQVVSGEWLAASTRPQANTAPGEKQYGFQWWVPADGRPGEFQAEGIYGQYVYFNRELDVAIVMTAADTNFRDSGVDARNTAHFRLIAELAAARG